MDEAGLNPGLSDSSAYARTLPSLPLPCPPPLSLHPSTPVQPEHIQGTLLVPHLCGARCPAAARQVLATSHLLGIKPAPLCRPLEWSLSPFGPCAGFHLQGKADVESRDLAENKNGTRCMKLESKEVPRGEAGRPRIPHIFGDNSSCSEPPSDLLCT